MTKTPPPIRGCKGLRRKARNDAGIQSLPFWSRRGELRKLKQQIPMKHSLKTINMKTNLRTVRESSPVLQAAISRAILAILPHREVPARYPGHSRA